jgi:hypothetical protein
MFDCPWTELIIGSGFPITWVFVKDINFHQFLHIQLAKSGNTVANMWNGMNFAGDVGRSVIETYVKTPATSSILGYPRNYLENEHLAAERGSSQRRPLRATRGARSAVRPAQLEVSNLKQMPSRRDTVSSHTIHDTGMSKSRPQLKINTATPPPLFQLPMPQIAREAASGPAFPNSPGKAGHCTSAEIDKVPSRMWATRPNKPITLPSTLPRSSTEPALKLDALLDQEMTSSQLSSYQQVETRKPYAFAPWPQTPSPRTDRVAAQDSCRLCHDHDYHIDHGHDDDAGFGGSRWQSPMLLSPVKTPTHLPIRRSDGQGSFVASHSPTPRTEPNARQKEAQLKSKLHLLLADKFTVDGRLAEDKIERHIQEQLNVKRAHLLYSIHEIEQELARLTLQGLDMPPVATVRRDSTQPSNDIASSALGMCNISPVFAANRRSPHLLSQHAPEPQAFQRKHGFTASWDQRIAGDIAKLVAGVEDENLNVGLGLRLREQAGWYGDEAFRPRADSSLEMYQDPSDNGGIVIAREYNSAKRWHD